MIVTANNDNYFLTKKKEYTAMKKAMLFKAKSLARSMKFSLSGGYIEKGDIIRLNWSLTLHNVRPPYC